MKSTLALPTIKGFSILKFLRLRLGTSLRALCGKLGITNSPKKVVFLHIPKTAGTTAKDYIISCVGSRKAKKSVTLTTNVPNLDASEEEIDTAQKARFVNGHFCWATKLKLNDNSAVSFTSLCDPSERLWSWYYTLRATPEKWKNNRIAALYELSETCEPHEFFSQENELLRYKIDNMMVRQLAGDLDHLPADDAEWQVALEAAKKNLLSFDVVCFKETFDADFANVLRTAQLPVILPIGRRNVTSDRAFDPAKKEKARKEFIERSASLLEPYVKWDRHLYDFALEMRAQGRL